MFKVEQHGVNRGQGRQHNQGLRHGYGIVDIEDLHSGVEYLVREGHVDPDRVGMWGWSGGGTSTLLTLTRSKELRAGISVAPVTDWRFYDSIYTERYLGMPRNDDGSPTDAYVRGNVLTYADDLADPLLLIHGMADDNVLFTNSTRLFKVLQDGMIPFEMMTYPGKKHGIRGKDVRVHLFEMILAHFERYMA